MRTWVAIAWVTAGCAARAGVPLEADIVCEADAECPGTLPICHPVARRCIASGVVPDLEGPRVLSAVVGDPTHVTVTFSEPVVPASDAGITFAITPELGISGISGGNDMQSLVVTTAQQTAGVTYVIRAFDALDASGNGLLPSADSTTFLGFGAEPDREPPVQLEPLDGGTAEALSTTLAWSPRLGAASYTIEIDDDVDFTPPLIATATVNATEYAVTFPAPVSYYWRVRADVTTRPFESGYPKRLVEALSDTVFVHCDAEDDLCSDEGLAGNLTHPFRSIARGISAAKSLGITRVHVAARADRTDPEDPAYEESIRLENGVSVHGGFDASFAGLRDAKVHRTHINTAEVVGVTAIGIDATTTFEGFRVTKIGNVLPRQSLGMYIASSTSSLTVRECEIDTGDALNLAQVLFIADSGTALASGPLIERNTLRAGNADNRGGAQSQGIMTDTSAPKIVRNTIEAGNTKSYNTSDRYGIFGVLINSAVWLEANVIVTGDSTAGEPNPAYRNHGVQVTQTVGEPSVLRNNLIVTGYGSDSYGVAIYVGPSGTGSIELTNNSIVVGGSAANSFALMTWYKTALTNNLFAYAGPTGGRTGILEDYVKSPTVFHNNAIVGFAAGTIFRTEAGTALNTAGNIEAYLGAGSVASGTIIADDAYFDADYHLQSTPENVLLRTSGKQTSLTDDQAGNQRTCPTVDTACYSIGAYETD